MGILYVEICANGQQSTEPEDVYVAVWMFKANHTGHLILGS
jgi:hypothetical protein